MSGQLEASDHVHAVLAELSNVLLGERSLEGLLREVAEISLQLIKSSVGVGVSVLERGQVTTAAQAGEFVQALDGAQYESGAGPCLEAAGKGKLVAVNDIAADERWPHFADVALRLGVRSSLSLPLIAGDSTLGALNIYCRAVDALGDQSDQLLASTVAEHAAVAVANAQAFANERQTALVLQRSLLPDHLPDVPGYDVAVRYQPADTTAAVGGDWYDVFHVPDDGCVGLAIGDVMGHGIEPATVMGRLRTAVQAYAIEGGSPARVISNVDRLLTTIDSGPAERLATLCFATLTAATGEVVVANAGHLPPLLVEGVGNIEVLDAPSGPVLGTGVQAQWSETAVRLQPGAVLVFYTDGLIEDRQRNIDEGIAMLEQSLRLALASPGVDADAICRRLADDLLAGEQEDDAAILVIRRCPGAA
ncbi:MAG TPA: GAF domain-containing SpoIIE family protein phosphatase [Acidimicrobiales bacterium]|nr:GAF domain-containing SpoIIE family protein phosphatase [Acidimicrobiales bacterium]